MKTVATVLLLFAALISKAQTIDSIPIAGSYYESKNVDVGFYGFHGNTFDLTISKKKICKTCYRVHSKFFGGGFEIGRTDKYQLVGGPKLFYQRGQNFGSFRISLGMLTDFSEWIVMLRPEYMVHFFKNRSLSVGIAFNFYNSLQRPNSYHFGLLSLAARYYFEFDKET